MWSELNKGMHAGLTIPQVIFKDAGYFFWAFNEDGFFKGKLREEAKILNFRARNLKIAKSDPENWLVEYVFGSRGRFSDFEFVAIDRPHHQGSSSTVRTSYVDFSKAKNSGKKDKLGHKMFVEKVKFHYFGSKTVRMTKQACEDFFADSDRFAV